MIDQLFARADLFLLLLAVALYITDLTRLLYINELLFVSGPGGNWSARLPLAQMEVSRRFLMVARPLDPGVSVLRLTWPGPAGDLSSDDSAGDALAGLLRELRWVRLGCRLLLPQIFLILPLLYLFGGSYFLLLIFLATIYLQVVVLVTWLFARRKKLELPSVTWLRLAFESLICLPYAINLHRKLTEQLTPARVPGDVLSAGLVLLNGRSLREFQREIRNRALLLLEQKGDESASAQTMRDFLRELDTVGER